MYGKITWLAASVIFVSVAALLPDDHSDLKKQFIRPTTIPYPTHNPFTEEKYNLGKTLFFDKLLSGNRSMSCATCHNPDLDWGNGRARAVGWNHQELARKVPTILNGSWGWSFFWDGRAQTLEEQSLGPIQSEAEMNLKIPELIRRLSAEASYRDSFKKAFPGQDISADTIARALATFERTVVAGWAPFDDYINGDNGAISDSAKRGFVLFNNKASCVQCHTGWNFTNGSFADTGLKSQDAGRGKVTSEKDLQFAFKTPTLRNISRRGPYMHDGSLPTLLDVINHYDRGGEANRETTKIFLKPLQLSESEKADLIAFLETLSSHPEEQK